MPSEQQQEILRHKANLYKILSTLYYLPNEEMGGMVAHLAPTIEELLPALLSLAENVESQWEQHEKDLTSLKVEYTRLFIGPYGSLASPYSSVYLENVRQVMGESTMEALEHYRAAGLDVKDDFKEPPDHIGAELEFMYYLIAQYFATEDETFLEKGNAFLHGHLVKWYIPFTKAIQEHAELDFYKDLAVLTKSFIDSELALQ